MRTQSGNAIPKLRGAFAYMRGFATRNLGFWTNLSVLAMPNGSNWYVGRPSERLRNLEEHAGANITS